jgi:hypothetical protein
MIWTQHGHPLTDRLFHRAVDGGDGRAIVLVLEDEAVRLEVGTNDLIRKVCQLQGHGQLVGQAPGRSAPNHLTPPVPQW